LGIDTDGSAPDPSARLDVNFNNKGFLPPRLTTVQRNAIISPAEGLVIYNTDEKALNVYNGVAWSSMILVPGFACVLSIIINHLVSGGVAPVNKTVTYGTITNIPGEPSKYWITFNLGAHHQATAVNDATEASAGWYWQFNRKQGYKYDGTSRTPNTTWITLINENLDWNDPWNSGLKLHAAGWLSGSDGSLLLRGSFGYYWNCTQDSTDDGWFLGFNSYSSYMLSYYKAYGFSLRCLRD